MDLTRRHMLQLTAGALLAPALARRAAAADLPTKPVSLICPWPPGGPGVGHPAHARGHLLRTVAAHHGDCVADFARSQGAGVGVGRRVGCERVHRIGRDVAGEGAPDRAAPEEVTDHQGTSVTAPRRASAIATA